MSSVDQQIANQLANIEKATGHTLAEWTGLIRASGLEKHGQIVGWLREAYDRAG